MRPSFFCTDPDAGVYLNVPHHSAAKQSVSKNGKGTSFTRAAKPLKMRPALQRLRPLWAPIECPLRNSRNRHHQRGQQEQQREPVCTFSTVAISGDNRLGLYGDLRGLVRYWRKKNNELEWRGCPFLAAVARSGDFGEYRERSQATVADRSSAPRGRAALQGRVKKQSEWASARAKPPRPRHTPQPSADPPTHPPRSHTSPTRPSWPPAVAPRLASLQPARNRTC